MKLLSLLIVTLLVAGLALAQQPAKGNLGKAMADDVPLSPMESAG